MAYMCTCYYCNHYFFGVSRTDVVEAIVEHQTDKHSDKPLGFKPIPISTDDYRAYLQNRLSPQFWETLRNVKKVEWVEARLEELKAEYPSLV